MDTASKIEALLFFRGEPTGSKKLSEILEIAEEEIIFALEVLEDRLIGRGIVLLKIDDKVMLGTHPDLSTLIEKITKDELTRDLGRAGLETLSIVLYKNPISKREIDYIRGVNSNFIIRNLLVRGLIERREAEGERGYLYKPTFELLSYLGVRNLGELPEYESTLKELNEFSKSENIKEND